MRKEKNNMAARLNTSWHHMRRSPYQALAAILIVVLTFLTVSVFTFLIAGSYTIVHFFESRPQVQIYFKVDTKDDSIAAVKKQLQTTRKVSDIKYISKQDALAIYKEQNKSDPLLLELVTADILPASLDVSTYNINDLQSVVGAVKNLPIVDKIGYQQDVINKLISWSNAIERIGIVIILVLGIESLLIMTTIIGIKIAQRREEIEIMRLIGATNMYISIPYIYEGVLYGVIGTVVGWAIATGALLYYTPAILASDFLKGIPLLPVHPLFLVELFAAEICVAVILGVFSSMFAVSRYLD